MLAVFVISRFFVGSHFRQPLQLFLERLLVLVRTAIAGEFHELSACDSSGF